MMLPASTSCALATAVQEWLVLCSLQDFCFSLVMDASKVAVCIEQRSNVDFSKGHESVVRIC
jgi:hypothetical protein